MRLTDQLIQLAGGRPVPVTDWQNAAAARSLRRHQLLGRWAEQYPVGARPPGKYELVENALVKRQRRLAAQREMLRTLASSWSDTGQSPIIVFKGMGNLTAGWVSVPRYSLDIDVMVEDPASLSRHLKELGFRPATPPDDPDSDEAHEEVWGYELQREDVFIDIRGSYPVIAYPAALSAGETEPQANPGKWRKTSNLEGRSIPYDYVLEHTVQIDTGGGCFVSVPEPHMALTLLCLDLFKDYAETRLLPAVAAVPLGVIAEARDLLEHPQFDRATFTAISNAHRTQSALAFTNRLTREWLGQSIVGDQAAESGPGPETDGFPRDIWWDGFLVAMDESTDDLIIRGHQMGRFVRQLGVNPIEVGAEASYSVLATGAATTLERVIYRAENCPPLAFDLHIKRSDENGIELTARAHSPSASCLDVLLVDFGDVAFELVYDADAKSSYIEDYSEPGAAEAGITGQAFTGETPSFTVSIPWSLISGLLTDENAIPMILGIRQHNTTSTRADASTLVPVSLSFNAPEG